MENPRNKLLFVYNADSGIRNALLDSMHKVLSPSTYQCALCDITFGLISENKTWKRFREESHLSMEFYHKDEFAKIYGSDFNLPAVFAKDEHRLRELITSNEINGLNTPEELIQLVTERTRQ